MSAEDFIDYFNLLPSHAFAPPWRDWRRYRYRPLTAKDGRVVCWLQDSRNLVRAVRRFAANPYGDPHAPAPGSPAPALQIVLRTDEAMYALEGVPADAILALLEGKITDSSGATVADVHCATSPGHQSLADAFRYLCTYVRDRMYILRDRDTDNAQYTHIVPAFHDIESLRASLAARPDAVLARLSPLDTGYYRALSREQQKCSDRDARRLGSSASPPDRISLRGLAPSASHVPLSLGLDLRLDLGERERGIGDQWLCDIAADSLERAEAKLAERGYSRPGSCTSPGVALTLHELLCLPTDPLTTVVTRTHIGLGGYHDLYWYMGLVILYL